MSHGTNSRRLKKGLRKLEADLGKTLLLHNPKLSSPEFEGKLDFWISYYVTWLFRSIELPKDFWCDGSVWKKDRHILEFGKLSEREFSLKCELDIQDNSSTYEGHLNAKFEYDSNFVKFSKYQVSLNVLGRNHEFSSTKI